MMLLWFRVIVDCFQFVIGLHNAFLFYAWQWVDIGATFRCCSYHCAAALYGVGWLPRRGVGDGVVAMALCGK